MKFKPRPLVEKKSILNEMIDAQGEVNRFGIKILLDGTQWVIDAKSGEPALKTSEYEPQKADGGLYVWLKTGEKLTPGEDLKPSVWTRE